MSDVGGMGGQILNSSGWADEMAITPFSACSLGMFNVSGGGTQTSFAWPTANTALFFPFTIGSTRTYKNMFLFNGTVSSGNFDLGIYNSAGIRQVSTGTTAQGTLSTCQVVAINVTLAAGVYFMACAMDNITGTVVSYAHTLGNTRTAGVRSRVTSFVLPADASTWIGDAMAGSNAGMIVMMGITELTNF